MDWILRLPMTLTPTLLLVLGCAADDGAPTEEPTTDGGTGPMTDGPASESSSETGTEAVSESGSDSTSGGAAQCQHEEVDDCCCFSDDEPFFEVNVSCEFEQLCEAVGVSCPNGITDCSAADATADEQSVDCALRALADGAVGSIAYRLNGSGDGMVPSYETRSLYLRGNGTAYFVTDVVEDSYYTHRGVYLVQLSDADVLDACVAAEDAAERLQCLLDVVASDLEVCLPPLG